ncbi:MAG: Asp23/Gls24 family envelope stress response protein [Clostridiales bacterium]|nr:Asp23/Gls24 family envelope stress response protein [Candidatus Apopatocola equi]
MADQNYIVTSTESGNINIGEDVFVRIVSAAAAEVDGVGGLSGSFGTELGELLGRKSLPGGVRVTVGENGEVNVDVVLMVRYGYNVAQCAEAVQEKVRSAVEDTTGVICRVNVHVTGISFEKAELK